MIKAITAFASALICFSSTALAQCGGHNAPCISWVEAPTQARMAAPTAPIKSYTVSQVSNQHIAGLGADERLCPVTCPVSVHNPEGGKVTACYDICKVTATQPAAKTQVQYRYVRVIQPIIYVQNVRTQPVNSGCRRGCMRTRYGN